MYQVDVGDYVSLDPVCKFLAKLRATHQSVFLTIPTNDDDRHRAISPCGAPRCSGLGLGCSFLRYLGERHAGGEATRIDERMNTGPSKTWMAPSSPSLRTLMYAIMSNTSSGTITICATSVRTTVASRSPLPRRSDSHSAGVHHRLQYCWHQHQPASSSGDRADWTQNSRVHPPPRPHPRVAPSLARCLHRPIIG